MRYLDKYTLLAEACKRFKHAANTFPWNGKGQVPDQCVWHLEGYAATVIFTKETGYHSSGWWKNPDYERCYHLSISFGGGSEKKALESILTNLFGEYRNLIWVEGPFSETGKKLGVWHYRLFCDEHWFPIKPRGEVYSTQFTELGWKSFSELNSSK